jgi:hypothetical protein
VGLGGLEPPASSLSAITRSPLCGPAFSQVACDRRGSSNAFLRFRPTSARIGHAAADKLGDQFVVGKVMGLPGERSSPIERCDRDRDQVDCPTRVLRPGRVAAWDREPARQG